MLRVSESYKNVIVSENGGASAGCENAERKSCQNTTVECRDCAKPAKTPPSNAEIVQNLAKYDRCML